MVLSLEGVLGLLVFGVLCLYFLSSIRIRELAFKAAREAAERDNFQLLDQNVQIRRLSMSRDAASRWHVWREYKFDYSYDGVERQQGFVIMLGRELQAVAVAEPNVTLH